MYYGGNIVLNFRWVITFQDWFVINVLLFYSHESWYKNIVIEIKNIPLEIWWYKNHVNTFIDWMELSDFHESSYVQNFQRRLKEKLLIHFGKNEELNHASLT